MFKPTFLTFIQTLLTSTVTGRHRGPKQKLRAGYRAPSLNRTSHVAINFLRRVWHRALSLRYACIRSSVIILIPGGLEGILSEQLCAGLCDTMFTVHSTLT